MRRFRVSFRQIFSRKRIRFRCLNVELTKRWSVCTYDITKVIVVVRESVAVKELDFTATFTTEMRFLREPSLLSVYFLLFKRTTPIERWHSPSTIMPFMPRLLFHDFSIYRNQISLDSHPRFVVYRRLDYRPFSSVTSALFSFCFSHYVRKSFAGARARIHHGVDKVTK